jgi:hypothetical protein
LRGGLHALIQGELHEFDALCLCLAFDRLLEFLLVRFFSFSFLSCYFRVGVVNAPIKEEIEDQVWFEDRWMVAS